MRFWWVLLPCLTYGLDAQSFDAAEFFGPEHFKADPGDARRVQIGVPLTSLPPAFVDLGSSGDGDFSDRLTPAAAGLVLRADAKLHRTVQAAFDVGLSEGSGSVEIIELDRGASVAWHLQALAEGQGLEYLCELRNSADGALSLGIRVNDGHGFRQIPGLKAAVAADAIPGKLEFRFGAEVSVTFGLANLSTTAKPGAGLRPAVAASDGRVRVKNLGITGRMADAWLTDATQRQNARKALLRLRELAIGGTIDGVAAHPYPAEAEDIAAYGQDLVRSRAAASRTDKAARARQLAAIARAMPENALAAHEAGVAELQFGDVDATYTHLVQACKLRSAALTRLALADASRRMGKLAEAEASLGAAKKELPPALAADYALMLGRVQATSGDLPLAAATLDEAARTNPGHATLKEFAFSARSLTQPEGLSTAERPGPLGVRVMSDLPEKTLSSLMARLGPYVERFHYWLPELPGRIDGTMVIYASPVSYLNAALIAAGDNLDNVAGMFLRACIGGKPTILACRGFGEEELLRTLVHEVWHLAYATAFPTGGGPRWIDEGMAVYLSAGRLHGQVLAFDRQPPEYRVSDGGRGLDVEWAKRVVSAGSMEFYLPSHIRENYAASFAIVWQLADTDPTALRKLVHGDPEALAAVKQSLEKLIPAARDRLAKMEKN